MPPSLTHAFSNCVSLSKVDFSELNIATLYPHTLHAIHYDPIEDAYERVYNALLLRKTEEEKAEYNTLLRMYNNDYRQTVLAIETMNK